MRVAGLPDAATDPVNPCFDGRGVRHAGRNSAAQLLRRMLLRELLSFSP
jgi:hypothetical protein